MSKVYKALCATFIVFVVFVLIVFFLELKNKKIYEQTNLNDPAINMMILYSDQVSRR